MALSQVECLDDNSENWPLEESKPEFLYSEDQRLALEALIHGGRKAFQEYIQDHSVRQFLSEPEQNQLTGASVAHQPESEEEGAKNGEDVAGSLQYWPERSDCSVPEFDIGWPDRVSYRGVTRVSVYTQPPMDGKTHIKEVVRKTITQAQKVIAVVMDLFTDVDIFQDLLDASFRRRVAVYIILEATGIPYFLSMCKKATMHRGHLKNLRVRTAGGTVLHTHSHRKVCGQLSQKFMFVDGDRAVTGSYSYTWMASRLDRNLVTVLTGEAVETFDRQFRELYLLSEGVSLSEIGLEAEPEPQLAVPSMHSPTTAQKHMNPKYALLSTSTKGSTNSSGVQNVSERSGTRTTGFPRPAVKILRQLREVAEAPPIHPALQDLERANMMYYLPTWPEPDPSIDVIEDCSEPPQAHLTQAKLDETLQPICFKDALVHSTDSQEVPKEAKEVSRISMMSEEHCKNLKTANGPNATDAQGVQNEAKEVSSISVTSEEHNKNFRTTNGPSATDAQEVQKLAKEILSISATSEEHNENLRTANGLSTTDAQGVQKEAKEVSSISVTSELHNKNLRTTTDYENLKIAKGPNATDAQGVQNEAKEVSSISTTSEEHNENLRTANSARSTDTQEVQNEAKELSSTSTTSEEHHKNLRTANFPSTTDAQEVPKEAKEASGISVISEEHNENLRTANNARSTDAQVVQNEAKEISSISATSEEHNENLRTANSPSSTDTQEVQNKAKEISSISATSEEHNENLRTANSARSTDTQEVQNEAKELSSTSTTSEEHHKNLRTANFPSTTDAQEVPKEAKEASGISVISEEHNENLRTANSARSTDTQEVQNAAKDISSISATLEEHNENLRTANGPSTIDAQEIQKEAKEVSSISITSEEHYENVRTANGPGATNTQGVQKEAKEVSSISAKSKEHCENTEPAKYGSACNGSVQLERSQVDELNAARASQPMVEQQMQEQPHPQHASRVLSKCSEEKQETRQTQRQTDRWKPIQTSSRPPASKVHYQQEVPAWGSANTAGTRLDGHIQSPNLAGGITGGHPIWNANQLALSRPGWGSNPPSRDQPSSFRGFTPNWPAQTQLGSQAYHAPNRQLQGWPQGQLGWARPTHQGPAAAHWPPGPQGDARGHPSLLLNRHTQHRAVNGNVPEAQLWMR